MTDQKAAAGPDQSAGGRALRPVSQITDYATGDRANGNADVAVIVRAGVFAVESAVELGFDGSGDFRLTGLRIDGTSGNTKSQAERDGAANRHSSPYINPKARPLYLTDQQAPDQRRSQVSAHESGLTA
ncbi:conserved hypothetical protein [Ricinus communis]|uniref:Uncharacterized protein n=1 Tax=Ricinus communis TaxID=3988 RepID=B9TQR1_RICCO|nr:conserved hypothetical protein [Ricinus communis]